MTITPLWNDLTLLHNRRQEVKDKIDDLTKRNINVFSYFTISAKISV